MSQQDFLNLLDNSKQDELIKLVDVLLTEDAKRNLILSQPESILINIKNQFDLPNDYEIGELIHRLNPYELTEVIKAHLTLVFTFALFTIT